MHITIIFTGLSSVVGICGIEGNLLHGIPGHTGHLNTYLALSKPNKVVDVTICCYLFVVVIFVRFLQQIDSNGSVIKCFATPVIRSLVCYVCCFFLGAKFFL